MDANSKVNYTNFEEYLATLPEKTATLLSELRSAILRAVPEAEDVISYNMPAFRYKGILVYYAAFKNHIGFYPADLTVMEFFKEDLLDYKTSKGTIQFPLDKELPFALIEKIVCYRKGRNIDKSSVKKIK